MNKINQEEYLTSKTEEVLQILSAHMELLEKQNKLLEAIAREVCSDKTELEKIIS